MKIRMIFKKKQFILVIILLAISLIGFFVFSRSSKSIEEIPKEKVLYSDDVELEVAKVEPVESRSIELEKVEATFEDGSSSVFGLAKPFRLSVAAEGLGKARFMTMSSDRRVFVADLVDMKLSHEGKVYVLEDFDETTKKFKTKTVYLSGLRGPNSIAFHMDQNGQEWIYIALTKNIIRYPYNPGDMEPPSDPEIIIEFPNQQVPGETSVVWHITRTIEFYNNRLYVSVGSGCNSCEQPEDEKRAMIYSINPDGNDLQIYADGLRNAVGFTWGDGQLYATVNGADHLGPEKPDDMVYKVFEGKHYGWPYCYESNGKVIPDISQVWTKLFSCEQVPLSFAEFGAHSAPLGLEYFTEDAHPILKNTLLIALHGSFDPSIGTGYHIVRVSEDGSIDIFMDGFLVEEGINIGNQVSAIIAHGDEPIESVERLGRPVDILQRDAKSFFFTDDYKGRIYYIYSE